MRHIIRDLKIRAKQLKVEGQVLILAYNDIRTPLRAKILIWITVGYLLSPIDLIPDFIPVLGLLDDLIIVPLLITASIRQIPEKVLEDARVKIVSQAHFPKKKNWFAAGVVIIIWILTLYFIYRLVNNLF